MPYNQPPCGLAARFALALALLAGGTSSAFAQFGISPAGPENGVDPRADLRAEAKLPNVDVEEAKRSIIRSDKTLLGGESVVPKKREASQSLEALREQVSEQIKMYESEIVQIDAGIANLKSLLEAHKKNPGDADMSADYVKGVNQEITRVSNLKSRYEATIAALQSSATAMASRETALQAEIEGERTILKQLLDQILSERAIQGKELPPLKNAEIKVFSLAYATPLDMASVVNSIFGPTQLRVSIDDRTNSLVVMGDKESLGIVEALLLKMDQPTAPPASAGTPKEQTAPRRTLMLRVFWLANDVPGLDVPTEYLPPAVINSLAKLGLASPQLVTQTVTSISVEEGGASVPFSTDVPAVLADQSARMTLSGSISATTDNRASVEMQLGISQKSPGMGIGGMGGPLLLCEMNGSLAAPIGHFMVLGTANSVIADHAVAVMGGGGMGMGRGMEGGGGMGMSRGGMGRASEAEGGMEMGMAASAAKLNSTRFAFVVQVVEAESFAPEE